MNKSMFGDLLTQGIHSIKAREGKLIRVIQEDLGIAIGLQSGFMIDKWRQGRIPFQDSYIERLAREILLRGKLDQRWLEMFLSSANYPDITRLLHEFFPPPLSAPSRKGVNKDWGDAPETLLFCGRAAELELLTQWLLKDHCRLVAVIGIGGIGKTALVTKLTRQIEAAFECVIWRSLHNAPPLKDILIEWIQVLSDYHYVESFEKIDSLITKLISYLNQQRCLLVLDNVESILDEGSSGHYRQGYEVYGQLIRRLAESSIQSHLIITSREKPPEIALHEGSASIVRSLELKGLDINEGKLVLEDKGLIGQAESWQGLIQSYSGNPLALKLVAEMIREVYASSIADFLDEADLVFDQIQDVIDEQFKRLSGLEQQIMFWLAIEREAVSRDKLHYNLVHRVSVGRFNLALRSLRRRSMIDLVGSDFSLQNVILEYMTAKIVHTICHEIKDEQITLFNSHALIQAQAKSYLRESQVRLILRPILNTLLDIYGHQHLIVKQVQQILYHYQQKPELIPGYIGGNCLNLLICLGVDLTGYDFSHLNIWQAQLQDVPLHHVNFSFSDLTTSVFADTFGGVLTVSWAKNGLLAFGTTNSEVRLWDTVYNRPINTVGGHSDWVWTTAFTSDGQILASGGGDQIIRLWDVQQNRFTHRLEGHKNQVKAIAFSPNGSSLASGGGEGIVYLWDPYTGNCLTELSEHNGWIRSVAFSPDGSLLASGSDDWTLCIWDTKTGKWLTTLRKHQHRVRSAIFHPEGHLLASAGDDWAIFLWSTEDWACVQSFQEHKGRVRSLAFNPSGTILASGSEDRTIRLWDVKAGVCLHTMMGHMDRVRSVTFSPDGSMLASGSEDQTVRLWDVHNGRCLRVISGYTNRVRGVAFSPDGQLLASSTEDRNIYLWNAKTGQRLHILHGHLNRVRSIVFSPSGHHLASCSEDTMIRLWDVRTGEGLNIISGHEACVRTIAFSPNGHFLASGGSDRTVRIWDVENGQCLKILKKHTKQIRSVIFSPDGKILASAGDDQIVYLWDVTTCKCIGQFSGHLNPIWALAFCPNGRLIASCSEDHTIRLWDIVTMQLDETLKGHLNPVWSVAFSSDGCLVASGSGDHTIKLWDVDTKKLLKTLQGHENRVQSVAFAPDGCTLASGSDDATVKIWDILTGQCIRTLYSDRLYEDMNIANVHGLSAVQRTTLKALGAIEHKKAGEV